MLRILVIAATATAASVAPAAAQYGFGSGHRSSGYQTFGTGSNYESHSVGGYTTNRGTYVAPHQQTNSNSTQYDNYSARGNVNPYTGTYGTRSPRY
jgi:hypothetical protein